MLLLGDRLHRCRAWWTELLSKIHLCLTEGSKCRTLRRKFWTHWREFCPRPWRTVRRGRRPHSTRRPLHHWSPVPQLEKILGTSPGHPSKTKLLSLRLLTDLDFRSRIPCSALVRFCPHSLIRLFIASPFTALDYCPSKSSNCSMSCFLVNPLSLLSLMCYYSSEAISLLISFKT
jgi:hypothetical protein